MKQYYENYSATDFSVWEQLASRQLQFLENKACTAYLESIRDLGLDQKSIPRFELLNEKLWASTGWQIEVVPGLLPAARFFELLAERRFCASTWLRKPSQLDYLEEPDMFHDIFGHIPLLMKTDYANYMQGFGALAMRYAYDEELVLLLQRLYWFTVEFGLLRENGAARIYGAGIVSSYDESAYALSLKATKIPFDLRKVLASHFRIDTIQPCYFVMDSFRQLYENLPLVEEIIKECIAGNCPDLKTSVAEKLSFPC